jgi:hypothetical protein
VRRAKDNCQVPKWYYRPERIRCPHCRHVLKRAYPLWRKYVVCLSGRYMVISVGYVCHNPNCRYAKQKRLFASQVADALTLRGSSFALEVIVQIGFWRFWRHWTVTQIHEALTQERYLPISEREVLYLIGVFLVLLRCTYHLRLEQHRAYFRRHGLFVAIDALKPEKGNTALYVVRDLKFGLVLHEVALLTADHATLETRLLRPVKALGYRIRGIVSDDEKAIQIAVAEVFPGVAHQTCQLHCLLEAATPITDADRAFKKALKQAIRGPFYAACRALNQLAPEDPRYRVLRTYAELIRMTRTEGSKPPFALGGLRVFEDLTRLEASLQRSRKKGAIRSWINCWPWFNDAEPSRLNIGNSIANTGGWSSWIIDLTRPMSWASRARRAAASSTTSRTFWPTWSNRPKAIQKMPGWSPTSVPLSNNAGRDSLRATLGRNAIVPTTRWKLSSAVCARASVKLMAANLCMSSSSDMANGRSTLTRPSRLSKSCNDVNSLTKPSSIKSTHAFSKRSNGFKCFTGFAVSPTGV